VDFLLAEMIGNRIAAARKRKGWPQKTLGGAIGMGQSHIGHIEQGVQIPTIRVFLRLCRALGIEAWQVIKEIEGNYRDDYAEQPCGSPGARSPRLRATAERVHPDRGAVSRPGEVRMRAGSAERGSGG
jgi:transcriptional regulator with XRE-family HTH domain